MQDNCEIIICSIANLMRIGAEADQIHDALIDKEWSEDDIFLFIKAAEILIKDTV